MKSLLDRKVIEGVMRNRNDSAGKSSLLLVSEIFRSLQGESTYAGLPCTFVRLAGCNLRCSYCDTRYALHEGTPMTIGEILAAVAAEPCDIVEITGGEPLAQKESPFLARRLLDLGYTVLVETNGSFDITLMPSECVTIMDVKCPGSGEADRNFWGNIDFLGPADQVKFVITGRQDYEWARDFSIARGLIRKMKPGDINSGSPFVSPQALSGPEIIFSPVIGNIEPLELVSWILDDALLVRLQVQLHKIAGFR